MQHSATQEESTKNAPTREEIRKRAFEIHIERGGHGCDLDDYLDRWLQAERELQEKYSGSNDVEHKNTCVEALETKNLRRK